MYFPKYSYPYMANKGINYIIIEFLSTHPF